MLSKTSFATVIALAIAVAIPASSMA